MSFIGVKIARGKAAVLDQTAKRFSAEAQKIRAAAERSAAAIEEKAKAAKARADALREEIREEASLRDEVKAAKGKLKAHAAAKKGLKHRSMLSLASSK